jgi:hypothetical protein
MDESDACYAARPTAVEGASRGGRDEDLRHARLDERLTISFSVPRQEGVIERNAAEQVANWQNAAIFCYDERWCILRVVVVRRVRRSKPARLLRAASFARCEPCIRLCLPL